MQPADKGPAYRSSTVLFAISFFGIPVRGPVWAYDCAESKQLPNGFHVGPLVAIAGATHVGDSATKKVKGKRITKKKPKADTEDEVTTVGGLERQGSFGSYMGDIPALDDEADTTADKSSPLTDAVMALSLGRTVTETQTASVAANDSSVSKPAAPQVSSLARMLERQQQQAAAASASANNAAQSHSTPVPTAAKSVWQTVGQSPPRPAKVPMATRDGVMGGTRHTQPSTGPGSRPSQGWGSNSRPAAPQPPERPVSEPPIANSVQHEVRAPNPNSWAAKIATSLSQPAAQPIPVPRKPVKQHQERSFSALQREDDFPALGMGAPIRGSKSGKR